MPASSRSTVRRKLIAILILLPCAATLAAAPVLDTTPASGDSRCSAATTAAQAHIDAHRQAEAEKALRAAELTCASPRAPRDLHTLVTTRINYGMLLYSQQPQAALAEFRAALALDPTSVRAALNTGGALLTLHRYKEALPILEAAIARDTRDRDMAFRLEYNAGFAVINLCIADRLCDAARGQRHLLKAIELNPEFADSYFQLAALVNDRFRDSRRAMVLFQQACERGHEQGCTQYRHFKAQLDMLDQQRGE